MRSRTYVIALLVVPVHGRLSADSAVLRVGNRRVRLTRVSTATAVKTRQWLIIEILDMLAYRRGTAGVPRAFDPGVPVTLHLKAFW